MLSWWLWLPLHDEAPQEFSTCGCGAASMRSLTSMACQRALLDSFHVPELSFDPKQA